MNTNVINNYSKLKPSLFFLPLFMLLIIGLFLYSQHCLSTSKYIQIQKDSFFFINHYLGQYPNIEYNLTQLGDASIFLSFLMLFVVYAPKIWESLLSASLVSLLFSCTLRQLRCRRRRSRPQGVVRRAFHSGFGQTGPAS